MDTFYVFIISALQSLQKQVQDLKKENGLLKDIVKTKMVDKAPELLKQCNVQIPSIVTGKFKSQVNLKQINLDWKFDWMDDFHNRNFFIYVWKPTISYNIRYTHTHHFF